VESLESRLAELEKSRISNAKMFEMLNVFIMQAQHDYSTRISQLEGYVMGMFSHIMSSIDSGHFKDTERATREYLDKLNKEIAENKEHFDQMQSIIEAKYKKEEDA
jgi:uncharacterized coiled-coil protein SlyX